MEVQELKTLIKQSMREALREERLLRCKILVPYVDDVEQAELQTEFGSPVDYKDEEVIDMTAWIKHGKMQKAKSAMEGRL